MAAPVATPAARMADGVRCMPARGCRPARRDASIYCATHSSGPPSIRQIRRPQACDSKTPDLLQEDMSQYTGVRVRPRADGTIMYGCQIHIGKMKRWVGQWPTEEEAARAHDYCCMHEYEEEHALKKLNFPEHRHLVDKLAPPGIRQITKDMEREHRMAQAQIARRNIRPHDDPLVRQLLQQEPDLMAYQRQVFGSQGVDISSSAGPSHGAAPSQDDDSEDEATFWKNFEMYWEEKKGE